MSNVLRFVLKCNNEWCCHNYSSSNPFCFYNMNVGYFVTCDQFKLPIAFHYLEVFSFWKHRKAPNGEVYAWLVFSLSTTNHLCIWYLISVVVYMFFIVWSDERIFYCIPSLLFCIDGKIKTTYLKLSVILLFKSK